jgi:hypothetical protein
VAVWAPVCAADPGPEVWVFDKFSSAINALGELCTLLIIGIP